MSAGEGGADGEKGGVAASNGSKDTVAKGEKEQVQEEQEQGKEETEKEEKVVTEAEKAERAEKEQQKAQLVQARSFLYIHFANTLAQVSIARLYVCVCVLCVSVAEGAAGASAQQLPSASILPTRLPM